jgi:hypothetical protein
MDANALLIAMFAGAIGLGYFMYGKKQALVMPLLCGMALMIYPYFFDSIWALLGIGIALCVAPFFLRF